MTPEVHIRVHTNLGTIAPLWMILMVGITTAYNEFHTATYLHRLVQFVGAATRQLAASTLIVFRRQLALREDGHLQVSKTIL